MHKILTIVDRFEALGKSRFYRRFWGMKTKGSYFYIETKFGSKP
jgi:response regulator RpfG family c-di-GMP phosphodiesterase